MEQNPSAAFYKNEIEEKFSADYQTALKNNLLLRLKPDYSSYWKDNKLFRVVKNERGYEAIDDDPEEEPIVLDESDFIRYNLSLESFCRYLQKGNSLAGNPSKLNDRLFFIGDIEKEGKSFAYVLVFVNKSTVLKSIVFTIPNLLSQTYDAIIAVYPGYTPDATERRQLENSKIWAVQFPSNDFVLPFPDVLTKQPSISGFSVTESSVTWRGTIYPITYGQYAVIKVLYSAHLSGSSSLRWVEIRNRLESYGHYPIRMRDVFKKSPLWKTLVENPEKSIYCLNI
jgi:hypothetical protein